jgi:hypothetical protein
VIRFTGGEPLLSDNLGEMIDIVESNAKKQLEIEINSNLFVSLKKLSPLVEKINSSSHNFTIITSVDTWGKDAEYVRHGLDLDTFKRNIFFLIDNCKALKISITVTFNILSCYNFEPFIDYILFLKSRCLEGQEISFTISKLISPELLSIDILPKADKEKHLSKIKKHMENASYTSNGKKYILSKYERRCLDKVWSVDLKDERKIRELQKDFYFYIEEYDFRKKTSIALSIPQIVPFLNLCKNLTREYFECSNKSYRSDLLLFFKRAMLPRQNSFVQQDLFVDEVRLIVKNENYDFFWSLKETISNSKNKTLIEVFLDTLSREVVSDFENDRITDSLKGFRDAFRETLLESFNKPSQEFNELGDNQKYFVIDLFKGTELAKDHRWYKQRLLFSISSNWETIVDDNLVNDFLATATESNVLYINSKIKDLKDNGLRHYLISHIRFHVEGVLDNFDKINKKILPLLSGLPYSELSWLSKYQSYLELKLTPEYTFFFIKLNEDINLYNDYIKLHFQREPTLLKFFSIYSSNDYFFLKSIDEEKAYMNLLSKYIMTSTVSKIAPKILTEDFIKNSTMIRTSLLMLFRKKSSLKKDQALLITKLLFYSKSDQSDDS